MFQELELHILFFILNWTAPKVELKQQTLKHCYSIAKESIHTIMYARDFPSELSPLNSENICELFKRKYNIVEI